MRYYHENRTHLALAKGTPVGREAVSKSGNGGKITAMPRLSVCITATTWLSDLLR
jgi:hypothetical protein